MLTKGKTMKTAEAQVMLGVRVPAALKGKLAGYCEKSGIKLSYLVTQAIREKLEELAEDEADLKLAVKRKNEFAKARKGDYMTLSSYARKKGIKLRVNKNRYCQERCIERCI